MRRSIFLAPLLTTVFLACGIDVVGTGPLVTDEAGVDASVSSKRDSSMSTTSPDASPDAAPAGPVTLTVDAGQQGAIVTSDVGDIACPKASCTAMLMSGTVVTLTADTGNELSITGWSEPSCGREPTCRFTLGTTRTVTATFAAHVNYMHTSSKLYTVRNDDGKTAEVKAWHSSCDGNVVDMAVDRQGHGYLITLSPPVLYKVDLATAACTKVGITKDLNSLTFAPDPNNPTLDVLYATGNGEESFYQLNIESGAATVLFAMGADNLVSGDIAYLPGFGLYATLKPSGGNDRLARIDVTAKTVTIIGSLPFTGVFALGWRGAQLIGYSNDRAFLINPKDGSPGDQFNDSTGLASNGAGSGP